jgi:hypothetical protein
MLKISARWRQPVASTSQIQPSGSLQCYPKSKSALQLNLVFHRISRCSPLSTLFPAPIYSSFPINFPNQYYPYNVKRQAARFSTSVTRTCTNDFVQSLNEVRPWKVSKSIEIKGMPRCPTLHGSLPTYSCTIH